MMLNQGEIEKRLKLLEKEVWEDGVNRYEYNKTTFALFRRYKLSRVRALLLYHLFDAEFLRYVDMVSLVETYRMPAAHPILSLRSLLRHVRIALKNDGIDVKIVWGVGAYITEEDKAKIRERCNISPKVIQ